MRAADVGPGAARDGLVRLRGAILDVSDLDRASEPVPMATTDERRAVLNLAVYVIGLIERASRSTGLDRAAVVELALSGD